MELIAQRNAEKILSDKKTKEIISELKKLVYQLDKNAEIILFGSRARGDWHEESDWDFLILTDVTVTEQLKVDIRNRILDEIEMPLNEQVFALIINKIVWENNYAITNIYESISEEGITV